MWLTPTPVEFSQKYYKNEGKYTAKWRNCGWSGTQQQHRKHETKRTMISITSKPVEFSQKQYENEEQFAANWRNCGWSGTTTTTQQARKPERNQQQGRKIWGPSWNVCSQWHVRVVTWRVAAWLFNVGITSCRRIELRHFNNARPFWNKWFIHLGMVWTWINRQRQRRPLTTHNLIIYVVRSA